MAQNSVPVDTDKATPAASVWSWQLLAILCLPSLFWAGNFIAGRAVSGAIGPVTLAYGRWWIALCVLLPFAWKPLVHDWQHNRPLYWRCRWRILGISCLGIVAFTCLVYWGLRTTTATNAILLQSIIPIMIVLVGAVFYKQRLGAWQALGLVLSLLGVLVIILQGQFSRLLALAFTRGDLLVFVAVVCWAFYTLWLRAIPAQINRMALLVAQVVLGLLVMTPLFLWELGTAAPTQWTVKTVGALVYIGIFPSVFSYLLYNYGVARVGAARAGQSIYLIPVFGTLLSVFLLNEQLHLYHAVGIAAIFFGIVLSTRK